MDYVFTNGVIAVKETKLLGEKLSRMCESSAEDAFRTLTESGFGAGGEAVSVQDFEKLIAADERDIDRFILEYAPSAAEKAYFLAPRDFHNAKAAVKAAAAGGDVNKMLAPDGLIPAETVVSLVQEENYGELGKELGEAAKAAAQELKEQADGARVGVIFERALYRYLTAACKKNAVLRKLLVGKIDRINLLTAFRAQSAEYAEKLFLEGGTLQIKELTRIFRDPDGAERAFAEGELSAFAAACFAAKREGRAFTEAERMLDSYEAEFSTARKYDLDKNLPFLYYVFRRRTENENVRILFVCLSAGMKEAEIKARLRAG